MKLYLLGTLIRHSYADNPPPDEREGEAMQSVATYLHINSALYGIGQLPYHITVVHLLSRRWFSAESKKIIYNWYFIAINKYIRHETFVNQTEVNDANDDTNVIALHRC